MTFVIKQTHVSFGVNVYSPNKEILELKLGIAKISLCLISAATKFEPSLLGRLIILQQSQSLKAVSYQKKDEQINHDVDI